MNKRATLTSAALAFALAFAACGDSATVINANDKPDIDYCAVWVKCGLMASCTRDDFVSGSVDHDCYGELSDVYSCGYDRWAMELCKMKEDAILAECPTQAAALDKCAHPEATSAE